MNEDKYLIANIEDKLQQCKERYMVTNTVFLDLRERSLVESIVRRNTEVKGIFWGGFSKAERCSLVFVPEYVSVKLECADIFEDFPEDNPLAVVRVNYLSGSKKLNHRDYLGSLMGLGIKREFIGDIMVSSNGADIIVLKEICDFLILNYNKAGNTYLNIQRIDFSQLIRPEVNIKEKTDTVASLRLDNIIASVYGLSRTLAVNAIRGGLIFVNNVQIEKIDYLVKQGDVLVYRGKGKAVLKAIGGKSRKERIHINYGIYT